ncbi:MAG: ribokinase [Cyanobacteria bacterium Co-bin8]|nr:ribokinase [Cyanobacteria bacterium Co-bin8]
MTLHIFGSLNMDLVCQTPRLPVPGETILGTEFTTVPGGKGANQAVAAARLGAAVRMVGRVGSDAFGQALIQALQVEGIETGDVQVEAGASSGVAAIAVDTSGRNHIIVIPGANGQVARSDVERLSARLAPDDILLLQFEVPLPEVMAAAATAQQQGVTVIVDPAPVRNDLPEAFYGLVDWLTPNQVEAEQLVGFPVADQKSAAAAAKVLRQRGARAIVIKLGAEGVWVEAADAAFLVPAFEVPVVDTVAAGDAFNGGLAVALSEGVSLPEAARFATATAALSVSQAGAQPSLPTRQAVEAFLAAHIG